MSDKLTVGRIEFAPRRLPLDPPGHYRNIQPTEVQGVGPTPKHVCGDPKWNPEKDGPCRGCTYWFDVCECGKRRIDHLGCGNFRPPSTPPRAPQAREEP